MSQAMNIESALGDPRRLEDMFRTAERGGGGAAFAAEISRLHEQTPDNPVLAVWYYRLQQPEAPATQAQARRIHWQLAVPLGFVVGVVYWLLSDRSMMMVSGEPYLLFVWAPVAATAIIGLVTLGSAGRTPLRRSLLLVVGILALGLYAAWMDDLAHVDYRPVAGIHLPLLAWVAVGLVVAGWGSTDHNRFAFLIKSVEAVITGAMVGGTGLLFFGITFAIFEAIGVEFSDPLILFLGSMVAGLTPVLAVAIVFDPRFDPIDQRFDEGFSKLISTLGRFFLPLTFVVGVLYVITILFNFRQPFEQRDVLIVYNGMLFAVMALLVFATPVSTVGLSSNLQVWVRRGIMGVAILTVLVSVYALSAILYRTAQGGITVNRLMVIGWNVINIAILLHLLYGQWRAGQAEWLRASYRTARLGMVLYAVWALFLLLAIPWLFPK